jgi:hypothetical protein
MKAKLGVIALTVAGLLMATGTLWAHHSDAVYDQTQLVAVSGTVTDHQFINPHQVIKMKVKDADGRVTSWLLVGAAVSRNIAAGWTKDTLQAGDEVKVWGFQYRDGRPNMTWMQMMKADGKLLPIAGAKNDKLARYLATYGKEQLSPEDYAVLQRAITWIGDPETQQR